MTALWADSVSGDLWAGYGRSYDHYVARFTERGQRRISTVSGSSYKIAALWGRSAGEVWIAAEHLGLFGTTGPQQPSGSGSGEFRAIWGASATEIWLTGRSSIVRGDGTNWKYFQPPGASSLTGVWALDETAAFAVDEGKGIFRWNGVDWKPEPVEVSGALYRVWGTSANNVWAVGSGVILWWNGKGWNSIRLPGNYTFTSIHGVSDKNFWVGDAEGGVTAFAR